MRSLLRLQYPPEGIKAYHWKLQPDGLTVGHATTSTTDRPSRVQLKQADDGIYWELVAAPATDEVSPGKLVFEANSSIHRFPWSCKEHVADAHLRHLLWDLLVAAASWIKLVAHWTGEK